jgi:hypothetical protein
MVFQMGHKFSKGGKIKHGLTNSRIYRIWHLMKDRCNNKNNPNYKHYGGRGIKYNKEWIEFIPFYNWAINNGYNDNLTIERIDVNGNYEPDNCTWIPFFEQHGNTRRNKLFKAIRLSDNYEEIYRNQQDFYRKWNIGSGGNISSCLKGKIKSCWGWRFEYL